MLKKFSAMMKDEKGQALAEYGLILALIAVVCVVALDASRHQRRHNLGEHRGRPLERSDPGGREDMGRMAGGIPPKSNR